MGVRPELITLADNGIAATVDVSEMMGSNVHLHVSIGDAEAIVIVPNASDIGSFGAGDSVSLDIAGRRLHLFDGATGKNLI